MNALPRTFSGARSEEGSGEQMKHFLTTLVLLSVMALSATAHAQTATTVKDAIENCSRMGDYCSGFVTGALMLAPRTGELGLCDPDEDERHSLATTDSMLADWMKNRVSKGYLSPKDDGYVALTMAIRSLFPCKENGK
jgi:hypothetical protein